MDGHSVRIEGGTRGTCFTPNILNILVDAVIRAMLLEFWGTQEVQPGLVWAVGDHNIVLYADDAHIAGRKPIWIQTTLTAMVRMFDRVGLQTNLGNNKAMVFTPGFVLVQQGGGGCKSR